MLSWLLVDQRSDYFEYKLWDRCKVGRKSISPIYWSTIAVFRWFPDPKTRNCEKITCKTPSGEMLKKMNAEDLRNRDYAIGDRIHIRCRQGFHFDKNLLSFTLTCQRQGRWKPWQPHEMRCYPIKCPPPPILRHLTIIAFDTHDGAVAR